ncbi:MAG: DUF501 domain-containing protein [Actinomycetota bacterium]|nr:DUF501 domain-containing protein [Actinomycetota bacterium]
MGDVEVISWQLGRPARAVRRVAIRCPHGYPAVTEQEPFAAAGRPFPTAYYLTCPWLVASISRIEAEGGVARWTEAAAADPALGESLERGDAENRRIRPDLDTGIGGRRNRPLKCLHAHAAFALARPGYELGERILDEVDERWCRNARCAAAEPGG